MPKHKKLTEKPKKGDLVQIPVCLIEYREGGNTLWIHSPKGATVFRLKTNGIHNIESSICEHSPVSHADIVVDQDLGFCLGPEARIG